MIPTRVSYAYASRSGQGLRYHRTKGILEGFSCDRLDHRHLQWASTQPNLWVDFRSNTELNRLTKPEKSCKVLWVNPITFFSNCEQQRAISKEILFCFVFISGQDGNNSYLYQARRFGITLFFTKLRPPGPTMPMGVTWNLDFPPGFSKVITTF